MSVVKEYVGRGPHMAGNRLGHQRVLIVGDEKIIRSVLADILEMNGYEPITAKNGQEAIEM